MLVVVYQTFQKVICLLTLEFIEMDLQSTLSGF